jgi:hypothetical protein
MPVGKRLGAFFPGAVATRHRTAPREVKQPGRAKPPKPDYRDGAGRSVLHQRTTSLIQRPVDIVRGEGSDQLIVVPRILTLFR